MRSLRPSICGYLPVLWTSDLPIQQLTNHDIEQHLELVFEGNVKVSWDQFYYETERHMEAFHAVSHNAVQHPIAIQGRVKSVRTALKGDATNNVLNLEMNAFRVDPGAPDNGIGLEVSVWSRESAWLNGIEDGDEVAVLGVWKASQGRHLPLAAKAFGSRHLPSADSA